MGLQSFRMVYNCQALPFIHRMSPRIESLPEAHTDVSHEGGGLFLERYLRELMHLLTRIPQAFGALLGKDGHVREEEVISDPDAYYFHGEWIIPPKV